MVLNIGNITPDMSTGSETLLRGPSGALSAVAIFPGASGVLVTSGGGLMVGVVNKRGVYTSAQWLDGLIQPAEDRYTVISFSTKTSLTSLL